MTKSFYKYHSVFSSYAYL